MRAIRQDGQAVREREPIDRARRLHEGLMVGLRLREGINLADFAAVYGVVLERTYAEPIAELLQAGYLHLAQGSLSLTARGRLVADDVLGRLVAAEET
jgi:oxygen-independent coproporphyrinogen-3 oxidase